MEWRSGMGWVELYLSMCEYGCRKKIKKIHNSFLIFDTVPVLPLKNGKNCNWNFYLYSKMKYKILFWKKSSFYHYRSGSGINEFSGYNAFYFALYKYTSVTWLVVHCFVVTWDVKLLHAFMFCTCGYTSENLKLLPTYVLSNLDCYNPNEFRIKGFLLLHGSCLVYSALSIPFQTIS